MANYTIEVRNNLVATSINMKFQEFNEIRVSTVTILVNVLHLGYIKQSFIVGNLTQLSLETQEIGVCLSNSNYQPKLMQILLLNRYR